MTLKGTPEQARTRLLLALWELGAAHDAIKKGDLTKKVVRKGEKSGDYQALVAELQDQGAIAMTTGNRVLITPQPEQLKHLLVQALQESEFEFKANIGKNLANALLSLVRQMGHPTPTATAPVPATNGQSTAAIASYEEFQSEALSLFEQLDKGYNYSGLVPIWHLRREFGDRVSRLEFNNWVMQMQANQLFYLQSGEALGATDEQKQDSISSEIRGLLFYVSQPE